MKSMDDMDKNDIVYQANMIIKDYLNKLEKGGRARGDRTHNTAAAAEYNKQTKPGCMKYRISAILKMIYIIISFLLVLFFFSMSVINFLHWHSL